MSNAQVPLAQYWMLPPESCVDLTLAMRLLHEQAYKDGDLGADYWNSVIRLLACAGQMHTELLELRSSVAARDGK